MAPVGGGGFATKCPAQKALREALTELDRGEFVEASAEPLAEYLRERLKGERLRPGALDATKGYVDSYTAPRLGHRGPTAQSAGERCEPLTCVFVSRDAGI